MKCPYCDNLAPWGENKEVYGKNYGKSYMCYYCKDCDAYVGCHNNTKQPLGVMANKELRQERMKVHEVIDPLWKSCGVSRNSLYAFISKELGKRYHTGESDMETCAKVLQIDYSKLI